MFITRVGELKRIINDLPDDMPVIPVAEGITQGGGAVSADPEVYAVYFDEADVPDDTPQDCLVIHVVA